MLSAHSGNPHAMTSQSHVSDPFDWPYPHLASLDSHFRCPICSDYFVAPLAFSECMHSFCSLCIRRCILTLNNQCPSCRKSYSNGISDMHPNRPLEESVLVWSDFRNSALSEIISLKKIASSTTPLNRNASPSSSQQRQQEQSAVHEKIKLSNSSRYTRSAARAAATSDSHTNASNLASHKTNIPTQNNTYSSQFSLDDDTDPFVDENKSKFHSQKTDCSQNEVTTFTPPSHSIIADKSDIISQTNDTLPEQRAGNNDVQRLNDLKIVVCPICEQHVKSTFINQHIDSACHSHVVPSVPRPSETSATLNQNKLPSTTVKSSPITYRSSHDSPLRFSQLNPQKPTFSFGKLDSKTDLSSSNQPKRNPIPGLAFGLLSDKKLKEKLEELKLSIKGDRQTLISRITEYRNMYNANLDAIHPKSDKEIMKQFLEYEKRTNSLSRTITNVPSLLSSSATHEFSQQEEDAKRKHSEQYDQEFSNLIGQMKERKKARRASENAKSLEENGSVVHP